MPTNLSYYKRKLTVEGCNEREDHCEVAKREYSVICFHVLGEAHAFRY